MSDWNIEKDAEEAVREVEDEINLWRDACHDEEIYGTRIYRQEP